MKLLKITLLAAALLGAACCSKADDSIRLNFAAVRGDNWRFGLAFPVLNLTDNISLDAWTLTDENFNAMYFGGGVSMKIWERDPVSVRATAGWSANFSDFQHITSSDFGYGIVVRWRM